MAETAFESRAICGEICVDLYLCLARQRSNLSGEDDALCRSLQRLLMPVFCFTFQQSKWRIRGAARQLRIPSPSSSRESTDIIYVPLVNPQRTLSYPAGTISKSWTSKIVIIGHVFYKLSFNRPFILHLLHSKGHSTPRTKRFLLEPPHPWDRLHFPLHLCRLSQSRCIFR